MCFRYCWLPRCVIFSWRSVSLFVVLSAEHSAAPASATSSPCHLNSVWASDVGGSWNNRLAWLGLSAPLPQVSVFLSLVVSVCYRALAAHALACCRLSVSHRVCCLSRTMPRSASTTRRRSTFKSTRPRSPTTSPYRACSWSSTPAPCCEQKSLTRAGLVRVFFCSICSLRFLFLFVCCFFVSLLGCFVDVCVFPAYFATLGAAQCSDALYPCPAGADCYSTMTGVVCGPRFVSHNATITTTSGFSVSHSRLIANSTAGGQTLSFVVDLGNTTTVSVRALFFMSLFCYFVV